MITLLSVIYLYVSASISIQLYANAAHIPENDSKLQQWTAYKNQFNKTYESSEEDQNRMKSYFDNVDKIAKHNERFKKGEVLFEVEMNQLGDWFESEFIPSENDSRPMIPIPKVNIDLVSFQNPDTLVPETKNWVSEGAVTSVKDQGKCGSCWAFSTVGALESHVFIQNKGKKPVEDLSPQHLLDCMGIIKGIESSCYGGFINFALDYIEKNGIATESSYPYQGKKNTCEPQKVHIGAKLKTYKMNPRANAKQLKNVVGLNGPVIAALDSTDFGFRFYKRGIYESENCSDFIGDHAIVIVGYGRDENGKDYWLVKNSRGVTWGENGYARVARNYNVCGIENMYMYLKS